MPRYELTIALGATLATLADPAAAQFATETRLRWGRHTNITGITTAQMDGVMNVATAALVTDHGTNDVACNLALTQLGFSNIFSGGSHIINSQADFDGVEASISVYVAQVQQINFCGVSGAFGGCASVGGFDTFVVTANAMLSSVAGLVLAHEFGHIQGLNHDNTGLQIMDPDILTASDRKIRTSALCNTARTPYTATCPPNVNSTLPGVCSPSTGSLIKTPPPADEAVQPELAEAFTASVTSDFSGVPIEDVALNVFVDKIPLDVELFYDEADVEVLSRLLSSISHAEV